MSEFDSFDGALSIFYNSFHHPNYLFQFIFELDFQLHYVDFN